MQSWFDGAGGLGCSRYAVQAEASAMTDKLALGTVQFGLSYGVANAAGQVSQAEAGAILRRAAQAGVTTLDTAIAYGNSETVLGGIGVAGWRVVTKLPPLPEDADDCPAWVRMQVAASLGRLGGIQLEAVLLHRPADLLGAHGADYRAALQALKHDGIARAVGVSIYRPSELDALWPVFRPDLVQAPFNVLDRRLATSGWLPRLASEGVRVHTRSAFLQGLLLMPAAQRPAWFAPWAPLLDEWQNWCELNGVSPLTAALAFGLTNPDIECVVAGVDSLAQLEEILAASAISAPVPPPQLSSEDCALIEPSQWKLS
jgi:aryl-alcohol dehydrogenase-like predicted oxidoreductase